MFSIFLFSSPIVRKFFKRTVIRLSDRIKNKKFMILLLAVLGTACQFIIPYTDNYSFMLAGLVIYGLIGKLALDPVLISYIADQTPANMYARAYSIFNFAGMLSSIFAPYITGFMAEVTGKIEVGFYISGILLLIGGLLFLFTDAKVPVKNLNARKEAGDGAVMMPAEKF